MRHINFSKVILVMSYMLQYLKKFLLLLFVCPALYSEDSAPETNKMKKIHSRKSS